MFPAAPTSIVALLFASFVGLSLVVLGARDPRQERGLLLVGLGAAGFGAMGVLDVLFELGVFPLGAFAGGAASMLGGAIALARARA